MKYYYYWIAVLVFILDQITKKIIASSMEIGDEIKVLGEFFVITSLRNRGAAFGILQNQTLFFILITLFVTAGIFWFLYRNRNSGKPLLLIALGFILGGAFGNFWDRALFGEVVDFLRFTFGSYEFPTFNVADMGIVFGVGLILLDTVLDLKKGEASALRDGELNNDGQQQGSGRNV